MGVIRVIRVIRVIGCMGSTTRRTRCELDTGWNTCKADGTFAQHREHKAPGSEWAGRENLNLRTTERRSPAVGSKRPQGFSATLSRRTHHRCAPGPARAPIRVVHRDQTEPKLGLLGLSDVGLDKMRIGYRLEYIRCRYRKIRVAGRQRVPQDGVGAVWAEYDSIRRWNLVGPGRGTETYSESDGDWQATKQLHRRWL